MDPHEYLTREHQRLRSLAKNVQALSHQAGPTLAQALHEFQNDVRKHFAQEDSYYRILDGDKRVPERGLIHQLRNDHAAIIFTLESLAIRLRKQGPNEDWQKRLETLMAVFFPHLDQEDAQLFPLGKQLLTPAEIQAIKNDIAAHE